MRVLSFAATLGFAATAFAAVNEPCYGPNGVAGVCVTDANCQKYGGTSISGACPADPAGVKCCSKPKCGSGGTGNCRWTSDCAGTSGGLECPGPNGVKCCDNPANGFGGYNAPKIPGVGSCKQVAVSGAQKIVNAFPGRVREVFCIRDCACPGTSDHCCGLATDMMCSDAGGVSFMRVDLQSNILTQKHRLLHSQAEKLLSG